MQTGPFVSTELFFVAVHCYQDFMSLAWDSCQGMCGKLMLFLEFGRIINGACLLFRFKYRNYGIFLIAFFKNTIMWMWWLLFWSVLKVVIKSAITGWVKRNSRKESFCSYSIIVRVTIVIRFSVCTCHHQAFLVLMFIWHSLVFLEIIFLHNANISVEHCAIFFT